MNTQNFIPFPTNINPSNETEHMITDLKDICKFYCFVKSYFLR